MQPVPPGGQIQEQSNPSVGTPATPPPGGPPDWAHAHASLVAVLVLLAFGLAAIALWRTDRRPAMVLIDDDEPGETHDRT